MNNVEYLLQHILAGKMSPLADDQLRSRNELESLQQQIKEKLIEGLYGIFANERIVSIDDAMVEAYEQSIDPDIEKLFEHFYVEGYDRDCVGDLCDRCIYTMAEELSRIIEDYKQQDAHLYEERFRAVY
tara:strand:+ start:5756 stop:6142 length:387 start_codon:yes stop_codon:yes gene_type:complete